MRSLVGVMCSRWLLSAASLMSLTTAGCASVDDERTESSEAAQTRSWKVLNLQYQAQFTGWWCGPAATRIALSARMWPPSQQEIANAIGTTYDGTNSIAQVRDGLNRYLRANAYDIRTFYREDGVLSPQQAGRFWDDIVQSIDNNYPLVANVVATPDNRPPGYPWDWIYHYVSIIGYNPQTMQVYVADSALFSGISNYWLSLGQMSNLVSRRGYAYWVQTGTRCPGATGLVHGTIEDKYLWLGGCHSFLGAPISDEAGTPDRAGRYSVFQNGSIYWTEATGAHEVHGAIRDEWARSGWEAGLLGYPISDELPAPEDGFGRYSKFQKGSIYYTPDTGAHSIHGRIFDKWAELDYEKGSLGYPTSSEYDAGGKRRTDFQYGFIEWDPATDTAAVTVTVARPLKGQAKDGGE